MGAAIGFGGAVFGEQQLGMRVELSAPRFCLLSSSRYWLASFLVLSGDPRIAKVAVGSTAL